MDGLGRLVLDSFHPLFPQAQDFLITIAEPISRPTFIHEYKITTHSLYAAVSVGLTTSDIIGALDRFSKYTLPPNIVQYINHCGKSYGKIRMVLKNSKYSLEAKDLELLQTLLNDPVIRPCRAHAKDEIRTASKTIQSVAVAGSQESADIQQVQVVVGTSKVRAEDQAHATAKAVYDALSDESDSDESIDIHSFQIKDETIGVVAQRCLALHYPLLEEYDFKNDHINPNLDIDLRRGTQIRPYQEQSLTKMFGNGRAMSGIIVLPCGAGKTLVGVAAACTIRKGVVVLATSNMSAMQWRDEFIKWSNINPEDIAIFSSENKTAFSGSTGIIITTYSMVTNTRERAHKSDQMMSFLQNREWGLMILDEVHVVPARMFRRVIGAIKAHSKLGLTATLLREDDKIEDLKFLIGPKLYEANWMELSQKGFIARVQCAEVWCAMLTEFYEQYMQAAPRQRSLFCVMNPVKFQACQYLIKYHESRSDKIIVLSDSVYALEAYAKKLMKPFLYGGTGDVERQEILDYFKNAPECSTLFLSQIGDTSLDLPEATVLIQISAQYGSRRQEAQRLGRILRAKRRTEEGFNAFFYSLVSKDTLEMFYSSKRQAFLVNQGYAFKVITHLRDIQNVPDLAFVSTVEKLELLKKIMAEVESKCLKEEEAKESAGLLADGNMFHTGSPDASRDQATTCTEQNKAANMTTRKRKLEHNSFFKTIARENERRRKGT